MNKEYPRMKEKNFSAIPKFAVFVPLTDIQFKNNDLDT
jgi:hypothetical protein